MDQLSASDPERTDTLSLGMWGMTGKQELSHGPRLLGGVILCAGTVVLKERIHNWSELEGTLDTGSPGSYLAEEED